MQNKLHLIDALSSHMRIQPPELDSMCYLCPPLLILRISVPVDVKRLVVGLAHTANDLLEQTRCTSVQPVLQSTKALVQN